MYWENYGPYAQGSFDSIGFNQNARFTFEIQKKNYNKAIDGIPGEPPIYTQPIIQCLCAGNPGVLRYLNDDIVGIKGCEFILTLINKDNQLPITNFYSEEEDEFKLVVDMTYEVANVDTTVRIFEGFLIQEDSNEILTDIAHEIQLSFTDNLGALKNIDFYQASMTSATSASNLKLSLDNIQVVAESATLSPSVQLITNNFGLTFATGDFIFLNDSPSGDVAYKIILALGNILFIDRTPIPFGITSSVRYAQIKGTDVYSRIKLADAIRICLHATNMNLNIVYAGSIRAMNGLSDFTTEDFLNEVYIDGRTFLQDSNNWMSCYDVLDKICKRFNISLFQQSGKWYIIRVFELHRENGVIPGINYNGYMQQQSTGNITSIVNFGTGSDIEQGIEQSILRPYNFYRETFTYPENNRLLYNQDLQILGEKKSETVVTINGINYIYAEYAATGFEDLQPGLAATFVNNIRVVKIQDTLEEVERYLVIRKVSGPTGNYPYIFKTTPFEITDKVRLKITFDVRQTTPFLLNPVGLDVKYGTGVNSFYYLGNVSADQTGFYQFYQGPESSPDRLRMVVGTNFQNKIYETDYIPSSGLVYFYLGLYDLGAGAERHYKNLNIEIINEANTKNVINGHSNKALVNKITKNNITNNIYIDDTQKNSIYGTLFFKTGTQNLVRKRTERWEVLNRYIKLGEVTTREFINWRRLPRIKLECKLLGYVRNDETYFKMFNPLFFLLNNRSYFIFGKMEIDLRYDTIKCTLYEIYNPSDNDYTNPVLKFLRPDVNYEFKFLYK